MGTERTLGLSPLLARPPPSRRRLKWVIRNPTMTAFPSSDESFARLQAAGWSVGEVRLPDGSRVITGSNGENRLEARGSCQAEAWWWAGEQAAAVGMLRPAPGPRRW
jgi:hypothetical protein